MCVGKILSIKTVREKEKMKKVKVTWHKEEEMKKDIKLFDVLWFGLFLYPPAIRGRIRISSPFSTMSVSVALWPLMSTVK